MASNSSMVHFRLIYNKLVKLVIHQIKAISVWNSFSCSSAPSLAPLCYNISVDHIVKGDNPSLITLKI